ncbi:HAD family hydrolase [Pseudonocardia spinosispora]|uniref:HAD family hydrolase n=1 Tax=Pseudonocardia spinosispora TaxID=103441 RepID=UPI0003FF2691|nr:HAD family phosphatase [Pseudonocardia spinosispora]
MTVSTTSLIFDLGAVVVDWNPRYLFARRITDPERLDHFLAEVCSPAWNSRLDIGEPAAELVEERSAEFPEWAEEIRAYLDQWPRMLGDPIPGMPELLAELHNRGVPLFALTNWSAETWPFALERFPLLTVFRDILVSGEVRLVKPDPAIYRLALDRFGLDAATTLFIDDKIDNVRGAQQVGIDSVQFSSAARLRTHPTVASALAS